MKRPILAEDLNLLLTELGSALATEPTLRRMLQCCAETLVAHLDAELVRVWLVDETAEGLQLQASAGCATHLDGEHSALLVGTGSIGVIARDAAPCLTNTVVDNPLFDDQAWIARAGIQSFAGHPLVIDQRVIGVLGLFSTDPLPDDFLATLTVISTLVAVGIGRMRSQEALATSEQRFRQLFDHAPDYVLVVDPGTPRGPVIVDVNEAACAAHGYRREELIGAPMTFLDDPSTHALMPEHARRLMSGERLVFESLHRRKDGSTFPVEVAAQVLQLGDKPYVFAIERDLTDRKQMERDALRAHNLETLGVLAGGIAHDFNNLLTTILGNVSIACDRVAADAPVRDQLKTAARACAHARDLTQQLLTFTRAGTPIKRPLLLQPLVREAAEFATTGAKVRLDLCAPDPLWLVEGDEGQLRQVVHNLVLNAVQAMPAGGTIRLELSNRDGSNDSVRSVCLTVSDQGPGILSQNREHIFDPYFSTKETGSGLGLATAESIVRRHGGAIALDDTVGCGTTFRVTLPAAAPGAQPPAARERGVIRGQGRVLVMDDEAPVLEVAVRMVHAAGYTAIGCEHGTAAIDQYRQALDAGERFDAVILDLTVRGGLGGEAALQGILALDPAARVIVCSGYAADPVLSEYRQRGFAGMLAKPYDLEALSEALFDVVGRVAPPER